MSRNKQQGRYAGKLQGKHYRTRGVNNTTASLDAQLELCWREQRAIKRVARQVFAEIPALRMLTRWL